ncbi:(2Fe-2S)-binding protein [Fodinicola feengrottensis]|uniref:(2Fe-2S)-binding protein n=1 Tax=Fodinicola feengrottensis TaxID=435914 RepID=A0ABN2FNV6_9ACTN
MDVAEVYALTARRSGPLPVAAAAGESLTPASASTDPAWLDQQIAAAASTYRTADARVAGTMWWYAASWAMLAGPLATLLATGYPVDPALDATFLHVRPGGLVSATHSVRTLEKDDLPAALRELFQDVITAICEVTKQRDRPLWAIAADSLATQALAAGTAVGDIARGSQVAVEIASAIGDPLPQPRFVDIPYKNHESCQRFVHRTSCCLIYLVPGNALCTSCPRRSAQDRAARLADLIP